jgi:hypothetical protein
MARKLVVLLVAGLVLAPAASAKGPHAVLTAGPDAVEAGRPWVATIELNEFPGQPHPRALATRGERRVTGQLRPVPASMAGAAGFKLRMVLPAEGRWRLTVVAGKRRFAFPALNVGGGVAPADYVAFAKGGPEARQGAGGVWTQGPEADPAGRGTPLPPETVSVAEPPDEHGGLPLWIPVVGVALAGAGVCTFRARRWSSDSSPPLGPRDED